MIKFFINSILLCSFYGTLFAEVSKPTALSEVLMDSKYVETIAPDLPAKAIGVDVLENVWFIGNHFLWKWIPNRQVLQKIKLLTELPLKQLLVKDDQIFVSDDQQIFHIENNPSKITSFSSPEESSQSLGFDFNSQNKFWIKTDGIYELSLEENSLKKIANHNIKPLQDSKYLYVSSQKTLWMLRNKKLSYLDYSKSKKSKEVFGNISDNIQDIQKVGKDVFALSRHAIFRYSERGILIQTVPVNSNRRLVLSTLRKHSHVYIFQDRLLEIYKPEDKKTFHFYLELERIHKATMMSFQNTYLGFIFDGKPRVFEFSPNAWAS